jgi:branched-subunit amino acid ABC-type transport system permease component
METFIQQIINGLVLGSLYALIALGYTMVYGILNLINFAHGDVLMIGALTAWWVITVLMKMVRHISFLPFAVYRVGLGLVLLALIYSGMPLGAVN